MADTNLGQLLQELVDDELAAIRSAVEGGRTQHQLKTLDERGTAQQLIQVQYSGRYPLELLQNADDALGKRAGGVRFELTDAALIVADDGRGFDKAGLRSICGLGRTSKDPSESIGYKGIGFKSVGEISDRPQIITSEVRFGFNSERLRREVEALVGVLPADQRLPAYAFPFALTEDDLGEDAEVVQRCLADGFTTVLRLPLRADMDRADVAARLEATIVPRLLLLLEGIERLEVRGTAQAFTAERIVVAGEDHRDVQLTAGGAVERWKVFSQEIKVPDTQRLTALGEKWADVEAVRVAIALPFDGVTVPRQGFPLHVYFATAETTGLPFIVHGDFAVDMDRRHASNLPEAQDHNRWLLRETARVIAEHVAPRLAAIRADEGDVVERLAPVGSGAGLGTELRAAYVKAMASTAFVPTAQGNLCTPKEAIFLSTAAPEVETTYRILDIARIPSLVTSKVQWSATARRFLCNELESSTQPTIATLALLHEPASQEPEALYRWLLAWRSPPDTSNELASLLSNIACVRTTAGSWVTPSSDVFFPPEGDVPALPADLPVMVADLPSNIDGLRQLLRKAGVSPWGWRELVLDSLVPILSDADAPSDRRAQAEQTLRVFYDRAEPSVKSQDIRAAVGRVLLPVRSVDGVTALRSAKTTYFSSPWLGHDRLATIYGPFGQPEFLAADPPADPDERARALKYLRWLGVSDVLRVFHQRQQRFSSIEKLAEKRRVWRVWIAGLRASDAMDCGYGHDEQHQVLTFPSLDRISPLIVNGDPERLLALWHELIDHWEVYAGELRGTVLCGAPAHHMPTARAIPSPTSAGLMACECLPAVTDGEPVLAPARGSWRPAGIPSAAARMVTTVAKPLADRPGSEAVWAALGVIDGARPTAKDLVDLLRHLEAALPAIRDREDAEAERRLFDAAAWATRQLDRTLSADSKIDVDLSDLKLVARIGGKRLFCERPYRCDDPQLARLWRAEVAVLDAEQELDCLPTVLDLPDLRTAVTMRPLPEGLDQPRSKLLGVRLAEALPYLSALAISTAPSRAESIRARLPRLELVACHHLSVESQLGDIVCVFDVSCHIDVKVEHEDVHTRQVGIAYVELDPHGPLDWIGLGWPLANFLDLGGLGDAFDLIFAGTDDQRLRVLDTRGISPDAVEDERAALATPSENDPDLPVAATSQAASDPTTSSSSHAEDDGPEDASEDIADTPPANGKRRGKGSGSDSTTDTRRRFDWDGHAQRRREIGRRGEELVVEDERRRLAERGRSPELVVWEADADEFSPFDIRSLDIDGSEIFIEVKATPSSDPCSAFELSARELAVGLENPDHYFIYRVTDVYADPPSIYRYRYSDIRDSIESTPSKMMIELPAPTATQMDAGS
jgi:hypothetical protein